jgi:hypothetical protein
MVLAGALLVLPKALPAQGVTTAGVDGRVTDQRGAPIAQAVVEVLNASNGLRWQVETDPSGHYFLEYLPVGGPYRIAARAVGFAPSDRDGIVLTLGQRHRADIALQSEVYHLAELTVEAAVDPLINPGRTGPAQIVSDSTIRRLPNGTRDIIKLATLSPQVRTSATTVNGFSVDGQNSRFNSFQVDGAAWNDRFAFAGSGGLPGAAVDAHLIGIEAVQEMQVLASPFDVRYGNFAGGLVNLVTKSGSNRFHGTLFGYFQNQSLTGDDSDGNEPGSFTTLPFGAILGGPIIRDRLHFFLSADLSRLDIPYVGPVIGTDTTNGADSAGVGIRYSSAVRFQDILRERHGFDAGSFGAEDFHLPTRDWLAKATAHLGINSRLEISQHFSAGHVSGFQDCRFPYDCYSLSSSDIVPRFHSSGTRIVWSQLLGGRVANELIVGYLRLRDSCETSRFPLVRVNVDEGVLQAGAPTGCSTFRVTQNALEFTDNATFAVGSHRFTVGTHNELLSLHDGFFSGSTGVWAFESLDSLAAGTPAFYQRALPGPLQPSGPTARFRMQQFGLHAQDQWNPTPRLTLTGGLRLDVPFISGRPASNPAVQDQFGVNTAKLPSGNVLWSPRLGFSYDLTGKGTTSVRGGIGLFAGAAPYSWLAGAFKSTGLEQQLLTCEGAEAPRFDPANQPTNCGASPAQPLPTVNFFDPGLRSPQVVKLALGIDQRLPWGTVGTIDIVYTRGIHQFYYDDVNLLPPESASAGEGGRPLYGTIDPETGEATPLHRSPNFDQVIRVSDRSGDHALSLAFQLQKRFGGGLELAGSYAYLAARDLETLANTLPTSLEQATPLDGSLEDRRVRPAQDDRSHRIQLSGSADLPLGLRGSFFYLGSSGPRFTYTVDGDANADGVSTRFPGGSNDPVYVPGDIRPGGDIHLVVFDDAAQLFVPAAAADYDRLASFIERESCLRAHRGHLLPRNSCRDGWETESRARLSKLVGLGAERSLELTVDLVNFLHLLSSRWGRHRSIAGGAETSALLHLVGYEPAAERGIYEFVPPAGAFDETAPWHVQLGARYSF